jgi:DNA-binding NtrC family response regulator
MTGLAVLPLSQRKDEPVELLIADDDPTLRSLVASRARDAVDALVVYEAADGAEAIQIALQRRPQIALLDVNVPPLGGMQVALVLSELLPGLRLALHSGDPSAYGDDVRGFRLPLFDKLESEAALRWLTTQAEICAAHAARLSAAQKLTLECSACGYGIARSTPPERCPMCQKEGTWVHAAWRPFTRGRRTA